MMKELILASLSALAATSAIGIMYNTNKLDQKRPESVYVKDVNGDKVNDVIIRSHGGDISLYLGQPDGSFKSLPQVDSELVERVKKELSINYKQ